jgi:peptide/nickel transport system permease protein
MVGRLALMGWPNSTRPGCLVQRTLQTMLATLVRRTLAGLAVVIGVVTLMFFLIRLAPGDPALLLVGPSATPEQVTAQREALGLNRPLPEQYVTWLGRFVRGDWGSSIATGRPVRGMIADAWPATVSLVGLSLCLSYLIGIAVGAIQATRGGRLDTSLSVITVTLFALPGYWLGLMLVMVFTYWARVLPAFGAAGFDADFLTGWDRVADRLRHLALPLTTLTLIGIGGTARFVRGAMLDVRNAPHVAIARAKGLSPIEVTVRHVLRNALIPVLTLLGLSLPALFSGAVFIEAIFAWPGVGRVLVEAVGARDYPVIMAATAVSAVLVVLGSLLAEALAAWADPRLRAPQLSTRTA